MSSSILAGPRLENEGGEAENWVEVNNCRGRDLLFVATRAPFPSRVLPALGSPAASLFDLSPHGAHATEGRRGRACQVIAGGRGIVAAEKCGEDTYDLPSPDSLHLCTPVPRFPDFDSGGRQTRGVPLPPCTPWPGCLAATFPYCRLADRIITGRKSCAQIFHELLLWPLDQKDRGLWKVGN